MGEVAVESAFSKFDPSTMKTDSVVVIVGKRGTGKTVLLLDLLYHLRHKLDFGCTMTPTMSSMEEFERRCPAIASFDKFDTVTIERIMAEQDRQLKKNKKLPKHKRKPLKNIYIVADDCMYDTKILKGKTIRKLFMNGRHQNIMFIILVQYIMDIPCDLRTQVDYVFAGREPNQSNRFKLWKNLFGAVENIKDFNLLMDEFTENREWLVLDNRQQTNSLEDCVKWYKAELRENKEYCVGQRRFWMLNHLWIKDEDEDDSEQQTVLNNNSNNDATAVNGSKTQKKTGNGNSSSRKSRYLTNVSKADENGNMLEGPLAQLHSGNDNNNTHNIDTQKVNQPLLLSQQQKQQQQQLQSGNNNGTFRGGVPAEYPPWLRQQHNANDNNNCYEQDDEEQNDYDCFI